MKRGELQRRGEREERRGLPFWVQLSDGALIGLGLAVLALIFLYEIHL